MAAELGNAIPAAGGLFACDVGVVNRRLRRTLHNRGGYVTPIELVEAKLAARA